MEGGSEGEHVSHHTRPASEAISTFWDAIRERWKHHICP